VHIVAKSDGGRVRTRADQVRGAALWCRDSGLAILGFALVLFVAISGWSASFLGLHEFAVMHMGLTPSQAWLVPGTLDGAPAGLSLVIMRAGVNGRSAMTWRFLVVAFTAVSSMVNYEHIDDPVGRYVAALMPPSAVILFEGLMSEVRAAAKRRLGDRVKPSLHPMRWVFDRKGTFDLYRRYVLGLPLPEPLEAASRPPVEPGLEPSTCEICGRGGFRGAHGLASHKGLAHRAKKPKARAATQKAPQP